MHLDNYNNVSSEVWVGDFCVTQPLHPLRSRMLVHAKTADEGVEEAIGAMGDIGWDCFHYRELLRGWGWQEVCACASFLFWTRRVVFILLYIVYLENEPRVAHFSCYAADIQTCDPAGEVMPKVHGRVDPVTRIRALSQSVPGFFLICRHTATDRNLR
jgi:hypothetical protein